MKKISVLLVAFLLIQSFHHLQAQDLCSKNPTFCKLLSDTAGVKMVLVTLPPGAKLTTHTHPVNLGYVIKGGLYKWTYDEKNVESFYMKPGSEFHGGPEIPHHSWNAGNTTIQFILVEKHG